jgi:ArsR family metal-binding transcriptional regulator
MKVIRNGRENSLTTFVTVFFMREKKRERECRSGMRNQKYRISEATHFDREYVDTGWESVTKIGNIDTHNHLSQHNCYDYI